MGRRLHLGSGIVHEWSLGGNSDLLLDGTVKLFIDTNVIVYAVDRADLAKQRRCREVLHAAAVSGRGMVSTQVLQQLFVVLTRKLGMDPLDAKEIVTAQENFEVVVITLALVRDAIDCSILSRLSFWDALLAVSAQTAACARLVTEALNHGQLIGGIRVTSPFA